MNPKDGTISAAEHKDCHHHLSAKDCIADKLAGDGINPKELKGCIVGIGANIMRTVYFG